METTQAREGLDGFVLGIENSEALLKTLTPKGHFSALGGERLPEVGKGTILPHHDDGPGEAWMDFPSPVETRCDNANVGSF